MGAAENRYNAIVFLILLYDLLNPLGVNLSRFLSVRSARNVAGAAVISGRDAGYGKRPFVLSGFRCAESKTDLWHSVC